MDKVKQRMIKGNTGQGQSGKISKRRTSGISSYYMKGVQQPLFIRRSSAPVGPLLEAGQQDVGSDTFHPYREVERGRVN